MTFNQIRKKSRRFGSDVWLPCSWFFDVSMTTSTLVWVCENDPVPRLQHGFITYEGDVATIDLETYNKLLEKVAE